MNDGRVIHTDDVDEVAHHDSLTAQLSGLHRIVAVTGGVDDGEASSIDGDDRCRLCLGVVGSVLGARPTLGSAGTNTNVVFVESFVAIHR